MKIVLDTNVIVAALMSKKGVSNALLIWLFEQETKFSVISNTLITEYEGVLLRPNNMQNYSHLNMQEVQSFIDDICLISHHQRINFLWCPFLKDIKDDMVLETAFNGSCDYIVTYNSKDFKGVKEKFGIKIIQPKEFLTRIGALT